MEFRWAIVAKDGQDECDLVLTGPEGVGRVVYTAVDLESARRFILMAEHFHLTMGRDFLEAPPPVVVPAPKPKRARKAG